ncbi:transcription antitermination factor NusB [Ectothiorhodospiraceae bacterium 2226]|nr:transcription antitermination factor NusB [Ectothiorhodospiraceae bacterium 2226]
MSRHKRSNARRLALQALYQWDLADQDARAIQQQFVEDEELSGAELEYFQGLLQGVARECAALDRDISPHLDRSLAGLDPVERAVLRLGAFELRFHPEIPYRVVINEAVELAKTFGADQGHKYVNGILDKVARAVREVEVAARQGRR